MGDLASYDAFTLGGPYSVHGYNMGELGAAHNFLEVRCWKATRVS
jgi:outer membrane protein assembly factor BamA